MTNQDLTTEECVFLVHQLKCALRATSRTLKKWHGQPPTKRDLDYLVMNIWVIGDVARDLGADARLFR